MIVDIRTAALLLLIAFALACASSSSDQTKVPSPTNINSSVDNTSPTIRPEKGKEEKSFSFPVQGGKKITAYVYPDEKYPNRKIVIFAPFLEKTDGNLYNASLHSLWSIYGKKRGLFMLEDAKTEFDSQMGGNAICWEIFNPKQEFCVFPIKDTETGGLGILHVWLK
jgi:hypothetical protein